MAEERVQRRLAAILAADVVGYSRLMEQDEAGTLATLKARREEVLKPLVGRHQGRVFKVAGDGVLVEFGSAVSAVQCAIDLQNGMAQANVGVTEDRRIALRIGVNLGDVIIEGADLYGDGVNIAARLETLAEPGGILVSHTVVSQVRGKVQLSFEDLGERSLKNLTEPVRIYRVSAGKPAGEAEAGDAPASLRGSIAVLPFTNMSGDPEQEYFANGLTEDIITELSHFKSLRVTARNSTFHFKGNAPKLIELGRELKVAYVLEGSVRKAGGRVRVTAQLVETGTGSHLWARRYDRDLADIFAVQDELISAMVSTIEGRMVAAGAVSAQRKPPQSWSAYDFFLRGRDLTNANREREAEPFFAKAIAIDPDFAQAHAFRGICLVIKYFFDHDARTLDQAQKSGNRALELDSSDANAHHAVAMAALYSHELYRAETHFERAIALNPLDVSIAGDRANWLFYTGRLDEALRSVTDAIQRDAFAPVWLWGVRGKILFHLRRYQEAVEAFGHIPDISETLPVYTTATLALISDIAGAAREKDKIMAALPGSTIASLTSWLPYADPSLLGQLQDGLRKAGVPE